MRFLSSIKVKLTVVYTALFYFHTVDVNKYRYIQNPIGFLIFVEKGHVYPVDSVVLV